MRSYAKDLAAQSYCYRGFKANEDCIARLKETGLSRIEVCGVHVDFKDPATFDKAIATYRKAGVQIVSIGVNRFSGDEKVERNYFEFAKKAGCTTISADFTLDAIPNCLRVAEKLADEYNINIGIHNHGGRHWLGCAQALAWVFKQSSPRIGLMIDTAWAIYSHEDPIKWVTQFKERLYGLHVKDFLFDAKGNHRDVVVGTGALDLPKLFDEMDSVGFKGNLILEYEGDVNNPVPALKECVAAIRKA